VYPGETKGPSLANDDGLGLAVGRGSDRAIGGLSGHPTRPRPWLPSSAARRRQLPAVFAGPAAEGGDKRVEGLAKWGEGVRDCMLV
jgi:hypothetical protein